MTLREMAKFYGVTHQRVHRVMECMEIKRCSYRPYKKLSIRTKYPTLESYLTNHKSYSNSLLLSYFPDELRICSDCKIPTERLYFHHLIYPAKEEPDLVILCPSCHKLRHNGKMNLVKQVSLWNDWQRGITCKELASKYEVSGNTVEKILTKIRNHRHTYRK